MVDSGHVERGQGAMYQLTGTGREAVRQICDTCGMWGAVDA